MDDFDLPPPPGDDDFPPPPGDDDFPPPPGDDFDLPPPPGNEPSKSTSQALDPFAARAQLFSKAHSSAVASRSSSSSSQIKPKIQTVSAQDRFSQLSHLATKSPPGGSSKSKFSSSSKFSSGPPGSSKSSKFSSGPPGSSSSSKFSSGSAGNSTSNKFSNSSSSKFSGGPPGNSNSSKFSRGPPGSSGSSKFSNAPPGSAKASKFSSGPPGSSQSSKFSSGPPGSSNSSKFSSGPPGSSSSIQKSPQSTTRIPTMRSNIRQGSPVKIPQKITLDDLPPPPGDDDDLPPPPGGDDDFPPPPGDDDDFPPPPGGDDNFPPPPEDSTPVRKMDPFANRAKMFGAVGDTTTAFGDDDDLPPPPGDDDLAPPPPDIAFGGKVTTMFEEEKYSRSLTKKNNQSPSTFSSAPYSPQILARGPPPGAVGYKDKNQNDNVPRHHHHHHHQPQSDFNDDFDDIGPPSEPDTSKFSRPPSDSVTKRRDLLASAGAEVAAKAKTQTKSPIWRKPGEEKSKKYSPYSRSGFAASGVRGGEVVNPAPAPVIKKKKVRNPPACSGKDRQTVLGLLQENQVLNPSEGGNERNVTTRDIDMLIEEGGTLTGTETYIVNLAQSGQKFDSFDDLADAIENLRKQIESEKIKVKRALGKAWNMDQVNRLFNEGQSATNTLPFLQQFLQMPCGTHEIETIIHNLQALTAKQAQEGRNEIINYLQSPDCTLFPGPIQLRQSDLGKLISAAGGYANALSDLRALDSLGKRFKSITEVIVELKGQTLMNYKRLVLNALIRHRYNLFQNPMQVPISFDSVRQLLTISGATLDELKDILDLLSNSPDKFDTIHSLAEHISSYSEERKRRLVTEMNNAYAFLGKSNFFKGQISVQNSDIKDLVLAVFNAHYGLSGGDVVDVLKKLASQKKYRNAFGTFQEMIDAAASEAGDPTLPGPPPEEQVGWSWNKAGALPGPPS